ncbi:MAG: hypothetical protein U0984_17360 [Prosthecobacter sp.]|nr:hypothetical protein [Prosthecobacter sp.]
MPAPRPALDCDVPPAEAPGSQAPLLEPGSPQEINQAASVWMKRGISLLLVADREPLTEALACFDRAIELRRQLPLEGNPWYRWALMAGWMNRADALTQLGSEAQIREALRCYDLAIANLQGLPVNEEPLFRWRLAVAWLNRGITSQAVVKQDALRCFDNVIALLTGREESLRPDDRRTLAAAWYNRANTLVNAEPPRLLEAREAAKSAIALTRSAEADDQQLAEAGLKARHVLCRALAGLLETPPVDHATAEIWIMEATDAVEEGLARGHTHFRPLLEEMFHFGARIYRAFQPHFLAEFLIEGIGATATVTEAMREAAREAICQAAQQIRSEGLAGFNPVTMQRLLGTLAALNEAGERLRLNA